ncbi:Rha family transcriptional regulator [Yersinia enterocolitica]
MAAQLTLSAPQIFIHDGKAVTTSHAVAEYFHKLHKNVLQKIEALDCSPEFTSANFSARVENIKAGAVNRDSKYYEMTKDGFVFLVMGFTGKKAAAFKEAYINEFNRMEAELNGKTLPSAPKATHPVSQSEIDAYNINALAQHYQVMVDAWRYQIEPALRKIESPLAGRLRDRFIDGAIFLSYVKKSLNEKLGEGQRPRLF